MLGNCYHFRPKCGSNFRTQYKSIQNLRTLQGYIFRICYNIAQPNFAILLFLVCSLREYTFFGEDKKVHNMNRLFRQSDIDSYAASLICQSISLKYFIFYTDSCSLISL
jgi:hypothetical protein